ncbi:hypothetical protein [Oryzihumus leptocrescens]|uniref:Uncharacterized protein n=1 Tax=Oryzihumus leptocrescens TaxID=297536 RepID=A0A542ZID6_9MICO|nr:hypothetical protein [Oryzihumus leptocrescens]TQL60128.1 hypothetical protein FB474_1510 [Oryzihumus leptocrescens]
MTMMRRLATRREPSGTQPEVRYDEEQKISFVLQESTWVASYESSAMPDTKKADMETGEDQKGQ